MSDTPETIPGTPAAPKQRRRGVRWALGLCGLCGVAIALYTGYWFFLAQQLRVGTERWIEAQAREGTRVRHDGAVLSGFPLAVRLTLAQPVIAFDEERHSFVWRGQQAVLSVTPWQPRTIRIALGGSQDLGVTADGKTTTWRGRARHLTLDFSGGAAGTAMGLRIENLDMTARAQNQNQAQHLRIDHGRLELLRNTAARVDEKTPSRLWSLSAAGVEVPQSLSLPLGRTFSRIVFNGGILAEPPRRLEPRQLLAWRDAGGTIEVKTLEVAYGSLDLKTSGTLALDEQLQPVGAFSAQVQGFLSVITALREQGLIEPNIATTAAIILGALATRPTPGDRPRLDIALSVQNRKLYAGPVALVNLPFIRWETIAP
ncbi:MAG: DUF2125 domain-containing protein [Rhodospirillales bacterium]